MYLCLGLFLTQERTLTWCSDSLNPRGRTTNPGKQKIEKRETETAHALVRNINNEKEQMAWGSRDDNGSQLGNGLLHLIHIARREIEYGGD